VWDSLEWIWGSECVTVWSRFGEVSVGQFGVGLGNECGTVWSGFVGVSVGHFGVDLGE
jgi:hypothetical protein